jgi:ornithine carbamoyltransferase
MGRFFARASAVQERVMFATDFLSLRDFTPAQVHHLLDLAADIKAHPRQFAKSLEGQTLALIFEKPSLRTRVSFDVGIQQLGGFSVYLSPAEINLGKRESIHDVAKNLERMVQGIMIRTFGHQIVEEMAAHAVVPVINGLTDYSHPCQAMADFLTIREVKGRTEGVRLAFVGDGNNVAHSLMFAGALLGAHVSIVTPPGYEPKADATTWAAGTAARTGGSCTVTNVFFFNDTATTEIYTDVWASMGQEAEAEARKALFMPYQGNEAMFAHAAKDAGLMHCLPAHRGEEVTAGVIDSYRAVVFEEAENRLHAQKAIMLELMK